MMKRKIFRDMLLLSLMTVLLTSVFICGVLYRFEFNDSKQEARDQASYISSMLNNGSLDPVELLKYADIRSRVTIIGRDGTVLFDNRAEAGTMENHSGRSEVVSALKEGQGEAVRLSDTLGQQTFYHATRLSNGTILRIAFTTDTVLSVFFSIIPYILVTACIVFGIALAMAVKQAKQLVEPINAINLEDPEDNDIYDELSPFILRIRQLRKHIDRQVAEAGEKQEQIAAITGNMAEGLVILDGTGHILSYNVSTIRLLGAKEENYAGQHVLKLNRSPELQKAVQKVLSGQSVEEVVTSGEKSIRLLANPVKKDAAIRGAILILMDVTEAQKMESFRREFSANVSHELKTPLTVISGYAELLKNNLVLPGDVPGFSEKIFHEASRLIKLVEDIIFLSRLDEDQFHMPFERMDLLKVAETVAERLQRVAERKGVSLEISGEPIVISAVPGLLDEMIHNLCDNAIQYNKENGKVNIRIFLQGRKAVLQVEDTGIGIPLEHQSRVFERFYRVDKSHSKETGGTGLGLSIVKHAALVHHAEIKLESTVGKGTVVTVLFGLDP